MIIAARSVGIHGGLKINIVYVLSVNQNILILILIFRYDNFAMSFTLCCTKDGDSEEKW